MASSQPMHTPMRPQASQQLKTPARTPGGGIDQTSRTPVIDFAKLEAHKENISRSVQGRSAAALSSTLSMAPAERARALAEKAAEFQTECDAAGDPANGHADPLEPWFRYVHWALDSYPTHAPKLVPLLERATRLFKGQQRYAQDARYLRLWVLYARASDKPQNVFQFLLAQEIGTTLSTLYEDLAVVLESRACYDQADQTYKLGIARSAHPTDRLKRRYKEYQSRVLAGSKATSDNGQPQSYKAALAVAMAAAQRSMLGERVGNGAGGQSLSGNSVRGFGGTAGIPSRLGLGTALPNNGRGVDIFRDNDENMPMGKTAAPAWDEFNSSAVRAQENAGGGPRPWQGEVLPQRVPSRPVAATTLARPVASIEVFRDSDDDETPPRPKKSSAALFGREESEESRAASRLREDPLANYDEQTKRELSSEEVRAEREKASKSRAKKEAAAPARKPLQPVGASTRKKERLVVPLELLYSRHIDNSEYPEPNEDAGEVCLEELQARRYGTEMSRETDPWTYLDAVQGKWLPEPSPPRPPAAPALQAQQTPTPLVAPPIAAAEIEAVQQESSVARPPPRRPEPTVTMMTAAARDEIKGLFNGRDSDDSDDSDDSSTDEDDDDDEPVMPLASVSPPLPTMMQAGAAVPPTPTPAARGSLATRPVLAAKPMAPVEPESNAASSSVVPATPAKTALGSALLGGRKPLARAPQLGASSTAESEPVRAQRVNPVALEPALEEEDDEDDEDDTDDEHDEGENGQHHYHNLTRVTEVTEMTRFTSAMRTPGRSIMLDYEESTPAPALLNRGLLGQNGLPVARLTKEALETAADRSWASTEHQDLLSGSIDEQFDWGRDAGPELSTGHTIARAPDEKTGVFLHERLGDTLVIVDSDPPAAESSYVQPAGSAHPASLPNPCSPSDPEVINSILASLPQPLESMSGYVDLSHLTAKGRLVELRKRSKSNHRRSLSMSGSAPAPPRAWKLDVGGHDFSVRSLLGEGGYGSVFLAEDMNGAAPPCRKLIEGQTDSSFSNGLADLSIDEDDEDELERKRLVAVKVESPPNRWEFYILSQMKQRFAAASLRSIIGARKFFAYQDESFLMLDYADKGSLLDVVNNAAASGVAPANVASSSSSVGTTGVEELLAMFFTIELLRLVEDLHSAGIIHGDLKIDNCLLRLDEPAVGQTWSNNYSATGGAGWSAKGVTLIDFGRAVDLTCVPADQTFKADWTPDARDCPEMREGRAWTYEADYFGIASVAFCLLFGRYIETAPLPPSELGQPRYKITQSFRRYWHVDLWTKLFDALLNSRSQRDDASLPISDELRALRNEMEDHVEANCNRAGKNLKGMLKKIEVHILKSRV